MSTLTALAARLHSSAAVQRLAGGIAATHRAVQMLPAPQQQHTLRGCRAVLAAMPAVDQPTFGAGSNSIDLAGGASTQLKERLPEAANRSSVAVDKRSWRNIQAAALPDGPHDRQSGQQVRLDKPTTSGITRAAPA